MPVTLSPAVSAARGYSPTARTASESWNNHGVIIEVASLDEAPALANALAAEHVQIATDDPEALFAGIRHAGSVFLGRYTPEAVGDYVAGPNHVLPTGGTARFSSALSTEDFVTRLSVIEYSREGLAEAGPHVADEMITSPVPIEPSTPCSSLMCTAFTVRLPSLFFTCSLKIT